LLWIFPRTVYCILVRYRSEFLSSWAFLSSEISFFFVIAAVRPKIAISSFFQILRVDRRIWETIRVFSLMSKRELWHPHVMGLLFFQVLNHRIWLAFVTRNSSLEPFFEGLFAQIHIDLSWRIFGWNQTGDLQITQIC